MNRSKLLSLALCGCTLALDASGSSVHAGPNTFEPRDDVTFGNATTDLSADRVSFGLSGTSTSRNPVVFGGDFPKSGRDRPDSKIKLNHGGRRSVSLATAIPEPSIYALIGAGLAGIALVTRRRRLRDR
ncbi:MAG TPA: PEP-CTERM sorting domain-containing protein [Burkholderiaceae bacterium]|nr:PEP-CTERM sorting domain-containing protein [Burkholderiaceae bacterium]